jgi:hypothetical protein
LNYTPRLDNRYAGAEFLEYLRTVVDSNQRETERGVPFQKCSDEFIRSGAV